VVVVAFAVRLAYALWVIGGTGLDYDANWFTTVANGLVEGKGWRVQCPLIPSCDYHPTANFGPLHPGVLSVVSFFGGTSETEHRLVGCLLGAATCYLVGRLGTTLVDQRVGLVAAALAAVYPMLIVADGSLMAEPLYLFVVLVLLNALATWRTAAPGWRRPALVGILVGLAALTRGEGLLLLVFVVAPWLVWTLRLRGRALLGAVGIVGLAAVAVLVPWTVQASTTFDRPVFTTNLTSVIGGSNCDSTYYGRYIGFWDFGCLGTLRPEMAGLDESEEGQVNLREGIDYAAGHKQRLASVSVIRVARTWGATRGAQLHWEAGETRSLNTLRAGWVMYLALLPFAALGTWRLWRSRRFPLLLAGPVVMVTVTTVLTYGNQRFRIAAEPTLVILAATGAAWLYGAWRRPRAAST
jgi:4-amino-4-deoxy-L-arabinose transferase-like glycosyltransferase